MSFERSRVPLLQFTFFLAFGSAQPFLSLYFKRILVLPDGSPATYLIGFVFFLQAAAGVVAAPLTGYLADKYHIQSGILTFSAVVLGVGGAVLAVPGFSTGFPGAPGMPLATVAVIVVAGIIITGLFQRPIVPLIDAETLRYLREKRGNANDYGKYRMLGSAGWIVSACLVGALLTVTKRLNFALLAFAIGSMVLAAIAAARVHARPEPIRIPWEYLAKDRAFLLFLLFAMLNSLALSSSITFGAYFMDDSHVNYLVIGLAFGLSAIPEVPLMWAGSWMIRNWGNRWMILGGTLAQAIRLALFVIVSAHPSALAFIAVNLLEGIGYGPFYAGMIDFVDRVSHDRMRTTYLSLFGLVLGASTALGGPFSSLIIAHFGSTALMGADSIIMLGSGLYFLALVRGHGPSGSLRIPSSSAAV